MRLGDGAEMGPPGSWFCQPGVCVCGGQREPVDLVSLLLFLWAVRSAALILLPFKEELLHFGQDAASLLPLPPRGPAVSPSSLSSFSLSPFLDTFPLSLLQPKLCFVFG